ncbi:MAG: VWA domain-containing protein [Candidatus Koribacter versatilis]|nr:VWA domain-containing protein [Candidatus Koribacter versatilis]
MPKVHFRLCLAVGVFGLAILLSLPSAAQDAQTQPPPSDDQATETLKVNVEVVQLFFNVKDKRGALIPNLTKDSFDLSEDGKPQTIKYFKAETDLPLTLGILIDASGSQKRVLDMEKEVGGSFLESILRPKDMASVFSFDVDVNLLQDFTGSVSRLKRALSDVQINAGTGACANLPGLGGGPIPCPSTGPRGTVLYDAVYVASHDAFAQEVGRKAMILLTDGEDMGSRLKIRDAVEAAQKADTICYVLLIADRGFYGFGGYGGDSAMKKLTAETGGRVIEVGDKYEKLKEAFNQISQELRSQYNLGYTPTNINRDGSFRKIEIKPKQGDYKIQARSGYYALPRKGD